MERRSKESNLSGTSQIEQPQDMTLTARQALALGASLLQMTLGLVETKIVFGSCRLSD
jgi:hypothetical protein